MPDVKQVPAPYYAILTDVGAAKFANAVLLGKKLDLIYFAVGDANGSYYEPETSMTSLKNELWRGRVMECRIDGLSPNSIFVRTVLPSDVGGFFIREMAVFDVEGSMIALSNAPTIQKVVLADGAPSELDLSFSVVLENTEAVEIKIDPTVIIASKEDINKHDRNPQAHRELFDALNRKLEAHSSIVVIPEGKEIPVNERKANSFYIQVTEEKSIIPEKVSVSPTMDTLDTLCRLLACQSGDLPQYVSDFAPPGEWCMNCKKRGLVIRGESEEKSPLCYAYGVELTEYDKVTGQYRKCGKCLATSILSE